MFAFGLIINQIGLKVRRALGNKIAVNQLFEFILECHYRIEERLSHEIEQPLERILVIVHQDIFWYNFLLPSDHNLR
jgi:hypothetical protein